MGTRPPPLREEGDERRGTRGGEREEGDEIQKILNSSHPLPPSPPIHAHRKFTASDPCHLLLGVGWQWHRYKQKITPLLPNILCTLMFVSILSFIHRQHHSSATARAHVLKTGKVTLWVLGGFV